MPKKPARVNVRAACLGDYEQIAALEARHGLGIKSHEDWTHFWVENPVYQELQPDWPIGWVLEDENQQIVGTMGNIPLLYEFEGKRVLAATGRSWVADLAYRSAALLLLDSVVSQDYIGLYVNNTVSDNALAALTALECRPIPAGVWDEMAYWVTNYRGYFQSVAGMKNFRLTKPFLFPPWEGDWTRWKAMRSRLSKPLSYPLSTLAFLRDALGTSLRERGVEVQACSDFDDRFDVFWESLKNRHPRVLLAARTSEVLKWHFKPLLKASRLWILTVVDGPRLAAYAIFDMTLNPASGFKQVRLVDYQSLDRTTALLAPLLARALKQCRSEGVHTLEHTGRWLEKGEFVANAAHYRRKLSPWQYFYRANSPELKEALEDKRVWDPWLFDGDATL